MQALCDGVVSGARSYAAAFDFRDSDDRTFRVHLHYNYSFVNVRDGGTGAVPRRIQRYGTYCWG